MSVWPSIRIVVAIVSIATAGSACGGAQQGPVDATGTAAATSPLTTARPSPPGSADPTAVPSSSPATSLDPPSATLAVDGGDPVTGQPGSYVWAGSGSDSPWLPGTPITAASGEPLTVTIAGGVAVAGWTARRVPSGTTDGTGTVGLGAGGPPVTFTAPARGRWSVQVAVRFAGGLGSATYYWDLTVR